MARQIVLRPKRREVLVPSDYAYLLNEDIILLSVNSCYPTEKAALADAAKLAHAQSGTNRTNLDETQARARHKTRQIEPEDACVVMQTSPASLSTRIPTWVSNRNRENTKRSLTRRKMAAPRLQPANSAKAEFRSLLWPTRSDQRRSSRFQLGLRGNNVSACSEWHESNQP